MVRIEVCEQKLCFSKWAGIRWKKKKENEKIRGSIERVKT